MLHYYKAIHYVNTFFITLHQGNLYDINIFTLLYYVNKITLHYVMSL